jgi:hypothetical protein
MSKTAASLLFLLAIATGAKLVSIQQEVPTPSKHPGGRSEARTVQIAGNPNPAGEPPRAKDAAQPLPAWLTDPTIMEESWERWRPLTDF